MDEDNISKDYFLFPENETIINNSLINNRIYISQYVERKELINARGRIKDISTKNMNLHILQIQKKALQEVQLF